MCGFCGFVDIKHKKGQEEALSILTQMTDKITHRGPNDAGYWVDKGFNVALGHRRLSIVDLSPEGHQPMVSGCGRYVIAFNGEIYNYQDIRKKLEKAGLVAQWYGHSDTEVMLAAIVAWGLTAALAEFNGMFAFALWDRQEKTLSLARDRLGEKPLYYGVVNNYLLFGSELKSLRAHPEWKGEIDRRALALYLRHNYIPAPYSIYKDIHKLSPGMYIVFPLESDDLTATVPQTYWSAREVAEYGSSHPVEMSDSDAIDKLEGLLSDSIRMRMEADVPLGAFLSGGIDSSVVVALMQNQASAPVKTFSIGFHEKGFNEAEHALAVATHLKTEHTELYVTAEQAMEVIPKIPTLYDEPFADSSQIPTFLVSEMAKKSVTVALSGDGGDELFMGYGRYFRAMSHWDKIRWMPPGMRAGVAKTITKVPVDFWSIVLGTLSPVLPKSIGASYDAGIKMHRFAEYLSIENRELLYQGLLSYWVPKDKLVLGADEYMTPLNDKSQWAKVNDFAHHMMYQDTVGYLPGDILAKVDRASMGVSLEARVPLLDHRLLEFAWRLPLSMKEREGNGKWLLRQVLYRHVPNKLIDRPKRGFGVPIAEWLKGPLKDWAEDLLSEQRLVQEGFFDAKIVRQTWEEHLKGKRDQSYHLWGILMFQAWLDSIDHNV